MRLPEYPKDKGSVKDTVTGIINYLRATTITSVTGAVLKQSLRGTTIHVPKQQPIPRGGEEEELVPFWPTLNGNATDGYTLDMVDGNVILRKNPYGIDAVVTILPGNIPDSLSVASGDKITCRINEDEEGTFTTAIIIKTSGAWPASTAPELVGGDNATGTAGERHIRLCEVVTVDSQVQLVVESTGHVDHFQPSLIDNTINTAYTTGAGGRVLKEFKHATGTWDMREIVAGSGVTVTETADIITLTGAGYIHPFKMSVDTTASPNHLNVASGQASLMELVGTAPDVSSAFNSATVSLANQDITQTVGVWVRCNYTYVTKDWGDEFQVFWYPDLNDFEIHIDTVAVDASDFTSTSVNTIGSFATGYTSIFIGKIIFNGANDWTIQQALRSDIQFSLLVRPDTFISTDSGNQIAQGTDGLLNVP